LTLHVLIQIALIVGVLLRPHREPASRIAWIVVVIVLPVLGILAYILLGETNIGRRRVERMHEVISRLPDNNGCKVVEALKRAAARGITCRAMADGLGSRFMIDSKHWQAMHETGVRLASALPIGNPLLRPLGGRIDLRNHRKIVVIDNLITYCGSQNCADPEFLVKAKYAPWVDAMMRFEGPIARQNQYLFISDWMAETEKDIIFCDARKLCKRFTISKN